MPTKLVRNLGRIAAVLALLVLLLWLVSFFQVRQAKHIIAAKAKASNPADSALQKEINDVNWMLPISAKQLGQPGSIKKYSAGMRQTGSRLAGRRDLGVPATKPVWNPPGPFYNNQLNTVHSQLEMDNAKAAAINGSIKADAKEAAALANYNANVADALKNLFEYIPAEDMAFFDLNSQDTQTRLQLAQKGLSNIIDRLSKQSGMYPDQMLNDVIAQIRTVERAREQLAQDGDKTAWIRDVAAAQLAIQQNRKAFLDEAKQNVITALSNEQNQILALSSSWQKLAASYNLNYKH